MPIPDNNLQSARNIASSSYFRLVSNQHDNVLFNFCGHTVVLMLPWTLECPPLNISAKLEMENKTMENRLRILKQMMSAEKARREVDGGIHWESGKPGPLRVSNGSLSSFTTSRKVHAKVNTKKLINVTILSKNSYSAEGKPGEKQCGQCEASSAMLTCVECIKNYCQLCFAKMHQKGGLAKHHVKPILHKVKPILAKRAGVHDTTERKASVAVLPATERIDEQRSLLDGTYDEATSGASFQEALTEWRSGNKTVLCNTSFKGAETNAKVSAMTGTKQVDKGSLQRLKNDIISPDTNRVTYFEKILIRRHKESMLKPRENQSLSCGPLIMQEDGVEELEEKESLDNIISEYNIFYDDEDVVLADKDDDTNFADFNRIRHCTAVVIGDMLMNGNKMESCESNMHMNKGDLGQRVQPLKKTVSSSRLKEKDKRRQKHVVEKKNSNEVSVHCSKTRKSKTDPHIHDTTCTTHQLSQSDLVTAVQSAWLSCTPGNIPNQQLLTSFFLHAVRPANNSVAKPSQLLSETSASTQTVFSFGCTTWVPSNSIAQEKDFHNNVKYTNHTPDQRQQECRDAYYDDSTSDSEPENERELFLSSKLGTHESIEFAGGSRAASSYEDLEREEEMERDKADCDALENLVCELQVSSVLDGLLIALSGQGEPQDLDGGGRENGRRVVADVDNH